MPRLIMPRLIISRLPTVGALHVAEPGLATVSAGLARPDWEELPVSAACLGSWARESGFHPERSLAGCRSVPWDSGWVHSGSWALAYPVAAFQGLPAFQGLLAFQGYPAFPAYFARKRGYHRQLRARMMKRLRMRL